MRPLPWQEGARVPVRWHLLKAEPLDRQLIKSHAPQIRAIHAR